MFSLRMCRFQQGNDALLLLAAPHMSCPVLRLCLRKAMRRHGADSAESPLHREANTRRRRLRGEARGGTYGGKGCSLMTRQQHGVLWDVDGVLLDSAAQHLESWQLMAREFRYPYSEADFWPTFGMRNADIIPQVFGVTDPEQVQAIADRKEALYRELVAREAQALPGARELLAALHAAGYRQALGSSAPEENLRVIVEALEIGLYLDAMVSGETVPRGKPAPDIFLQAAAKLGVEPGRCLVIEDAPAGVRAAHAGGMACLAVRRVGQPDAPGIEEAERVVDTLRDVDVALVDTLLGVR